MNAVTHENVRPSARILFVDDSRLMRMCARKILADSYELLLADSAEEAWLILQQDDEIQVLFTDLQMPGKSGFDLLEQIRGSDSPHLAELPVVLVTGAEEREEMRKQALERGATDFITKPFQASELMARATAHVDSGRSRRQLRVLERDHHLDRTTGLGNRRYCEQRLTQAISFASRHGQPLSLMHLRLEGLGQLLADLGEPYAERAQRCIGKTLAASIRREDTVFRTGEECFTFLLPTTDWIGATSLQERFLPDLEKLGLAGNGHSLEVTTQFRVQPIEVDTHADAARLLEDGLSGRLPEARDASEQVDEATAVVPSLDEALELIEQGEDELVRRHLPSLERRLRPLLALINARQ
jgi:two-component system, cell cycle response regulator